MDRNQTTRVLCGESWTITDIKAGIDMMDVYYSYEVEVKDSKGRFSTKTSSKDDFQEDAALVMAAIREQAKLKLDKNGLRDMQLLFTADVYENIESILNHQLDSSNGFGSGTIEFTIGYKSVYFETKGSVIVAITKRIEKDTSLHHRPVIAMFSGNR